MKVEGYPSMVLGRTVVGKDEVGDKDQGVAGGEGCSGVGEEDCGDVEVEGCGGVGEGGCGDVGVEGCGNVGVGPQHGSQLGEQPGSRHFLQFRAKIRLNGRKYTIEEERKRNERVEMKE